MRLSGDAFGEIEIPNEGGFWKRDGIVRGKTMNRSLFVGEGLGDDAGGPSLLPRAAALLADVDALDAGGREAIRADFERDPAGGTASDYARFHLEELGEAGLAELFAPGPVPTTEEGVLAKLELCGISVHRAESGFSVVLDYSIGRTVTDQLIAVKLDETGGVVRLSMES